MAQNSAATIVLQSSGTTNHSVGLLHLAGLPEADRDRGYINIAGLTALDAIRPTLVEKIPIGAGPELLDAIIYQRAAPTASEVIDHSTVNNTVRTMSRRTVGRGT